MMPKPSCTLGLVALSIAALSADTTLVAGFVSPRGTRVPSLASSTSSRSSLSAVAGVGPSTSMPEDTNSQPSSESGSSSDVESSSGSTPSYRQYATREGMNDEFPLPDDMEIPETRQLRWEREALVQSKYASGDEVFALRKNIKEVSQSLVDARVQLNELKMKEAKMALNGRINELERELRDLNERDAEFMYAVSSDLMQKAEVEGDAKAAEKYRVQIEEARLCIPQLNMHGLWVGKYGEYGYEMINVTYTGDTLIATKVTGDKNVPKGEITFTADLTPRISPNNAHATHLEPIELDPKAQRQWDKVFLPRHLGKGQVASENFENAQWMEGQMIMVGRFFSFAWVPIGHQIFFGRPSSELTIKMLREAKEDELKRDHVAVMRDAAQTMLEETYWVDQENENLFGEEGCFQ